MRAKVSDWRGLCLRTSAKWADFVAQSLHWKLPFPTQVRDWFDDWVVGSQFDIYCLVIVGNSIRLASEVESGDALG
jgi:hypothetical protein